MFIPRLIGRGVAVGAEYREHRKEVKKSRENAEQNVDQVSADPSSSSRPQPPQRTSHPGPEDAPPAYTDIAGQSQDRSLASGAPASEDKKAALAQYDEDSDSDSDSDLSTEDDEADWELDEVTSYPDSPPPEYKPVEDLVRDVLSTTPNSAPSAIPPNFDLTPLPCPVIIPQRRPRKKERGFIRAYPPLLGECSAIDQATFLTFLENFYRSSQASSVWSVIQISARIAGVAPSVIAMAVTTSVQIAAGAAKEVQTRHRTNDFLDRMNEEFFKPRGLFAMVVKYKTDEEVGRSENSLLRRLGVGAEQVDFSTGQAIAKYDRTSSDGSKSMSDRMKNIRLASGTTKGAIELPEAAPLVFPEVDKAIATNGPETFKDRAKDAKVFLGEYLDRRAQMEYTRQDPNSGLAVPEDKRTMKSQYSDPNHPMFNSGLIGLVSGGHLGRGARRRSRSPMYNDQSANAGAYGRPPNPWDSSRLYTSSELSHRDMRRHDKRERRALRTEQRMAEGRRVGRKRERRYEDFMYERESMYGSGDSGYGGRGLRGGRGRGGSGPIGRLIGAAADARGGGKESESNPPAPHASYGGSTSSAPYGESKAPAHYGSSSSGPVGDYGASRNAAYAGGRRRRRQRKGGPLGTVRRVMQEDLLYLMIVNMPSEAELAEAREAIAAAKNQ